MIMAGNTAKPSLFCFFEHKYLPQILKKLSERDDMADRLVLPLIFIEEQSRKPKKRKF